jgi:two-component system CheB/CheR fusion protein
MVGRDLRIRRFTPAAEKLLNLIPSDTGRPIGHIKPNIQCPQLEELIAEVIDDAVVREREVVDQNGNVYSLRIRPYRSVDSRIDGAVLTVFDNSALQVARESGEAIMSSVSEPILLLNDRQEVVRANRAFHEKFRVPPEETDGRLVYELGNGQWDIPALAHAAGADPPERKNFDGFTVEHDFPQIGSRRWCWTEEGSRRARWGKASSCSSFATSPDEGPPNEQATP